MNYTKSISENEFILIAQEEQCRACLGERSDAVEPTYVTYIIPANEYVAKETYPTWRTNREQTNCIGTYETPPTEAFPIRFDELALRSNLFAEINFDPKKDYLKSNIIIAFHCASCGVHVVKDGNHRLLQCAVRAAGIDLNIFEVVSNDWTKSKIDMKNFCKCVSNNQINPGAANGDVPAG